jgi:membrane-associated protease RseP (regulator of RpoE activity)
MAYTLGIVLFALGILFSICLHEAGHMGTAKAFGMKVTRYFAGFGPTLWSFRRGETEYGLKAIPAGGFVKIVGMTPLEDDIDPKDEPRAFWRKPLWQRTVVLAAGSVTHFILGFALLWVTAFAVGVPNQTDSPGARAEIGQVLPCVVVEYDTEKAQQRSDCRPGDAKSPAQAAGLRDGDVVTKVDGVPVADWQALVEKVRKSGDTPVTLTYERDGAERSARVDLVQSERPKFDEKENRYLIDPETGKVRPEDLEKVGTMGVAAQPTITFGPVDSLGVAGEYTGMVFTGTFTAIKKFPEKVPKLIDALAGEKRDAETPISVVGASRLGGEAAQEGIWPFFFFMLASLNVFIGIFNLIPLLPLDGGHIAIAWFEKVRSWFAAKRGRPDPGRVDYTKLMPLTYAVILVFGGISLLTIVTDIVNPISILSP